MSKLLKKTLAILLSFSMVAACVGVSTSTAKAAAKMPEGLTEITWSDFGVTQGDNYFINKGTTGETVADTLFSGYVEFLQTGNFEYGGKAAYDGFRFIMRSDGGLGVFDTSANADLVIIDPQTANVGDTFLNKEFLLQITTQVVGDDVKLGIWINETLYGDTYHTITGGAAELGKWIFMPNQTGNPNIISVRDYVPPVKMPTGLTKTTFSNWNVEGAITGSTFKQSPTGITSVADTLFSGYVTFEASSASMMYGAQKSWAGYRLYPSGNKLQYDLIGVDREGTILLDPTVAEVGDTFLNKRFLLQFTTQVIDSDADGELDDVRFGIWINGKLYNNTYFTYEDQAASLGKCLFMPNGNITVESYIPLEQLPTDFTSTTFSSYKLENQQAMYHTNKNLGTGVTVADTLFSGYVTFHGPSVTLFYGGTAAWQGIQFAYNGDEIGVYDSLGGGQQVIYAGNISALDTNVGTTFRDTEFLLQITTEVVGDDVILGIWINGVLYKDTYVTLAGKAANLGSNMFLNGTEGTSTMDICSYPKPLEQLPTDFKETTFRDYKMQDGTTANGVANKHTDASVDKHLFSGYITFKGDSNYMLTYGGKQSWYGIKLMYKGATIDVNYVSAAGADSAVLKTITATDAGVGNTFKGTRFLLQLTTEVVGDDVKLGVWINGVLYDNKYITITGAGSELQNTLFLQSVTDIESYPEFVPEQLPTDFKETTFRDYGMADGTTADGVANKHKDASVDKHLFSGYITFKGNSNYMLTYGGKQSWYGIKLMYKGATIDVNYVSAAGADSAVLQTITATDAGIGTTFTGARFLLQLTTEVVGEDVKLGIWINGALYDNKYITVTGAGAELQNTLFIQKVTDIESYPPREELPTGLTETTFATYGLKNGIVYDDGKSLDGDITTDLFSGYVTFHGSNIWFSYGGKSNSWAGIRFAFDGTKLNMKAGNGEFTETATFTSDVAGVELAENRFLLQLTATAVGDDMKFGVWFDGVLYNNEYITLTGAVPNLGKSIGIHQQNNDSAEGFMTIESYGVEAEKPAEKVPTNLKDTTFADYNIAPDKNGKVIGQEKSFTTGSVVGNLFSANVELHGDNLTFHYGGGEGGTWAGLRMKWNGTKLTMSAGNGEFTGSYTFTSEIAGVDLASEMFLLQISMEAVNNDVKLGMWFNGKLYNEEYITLTGAAEKLGNKMSVISWDGDNTNDYMVIESLPVLPKDSMLITPSEFGIQDRQNSAASQFGEIKDAVDNTTRVSLVGKTLSMDVSYEDTTYIILGGAKDGDWAGIQVVMQGGQIKVVNQLPTNAGENLVIDPTVAGIDITKTFNLKFTFEKVNANDIKVGVWVNDVLYNSQYIFMAGIADSADATMYLIPQKETSALSLATPDRKLSTSADGYEVKTLNDYGFENGIYTGASVSKEIAGLNTDKLVVSGKVELTDGGYLVLVGKNAHYRMSLGADAETGAHYVLIDSTDGSFTGIQIPLADSTATRFGFDLVQTKADADADGTVDDIELQVWLNDAYIRSYYLLNYTTNLIDATYTSICPNGGSVAILASLDVQNEVGKYYNLADGAYLVLVYTEDLATGKSYEVGETIAIPGDYKTVSTVGGTTITNYVHLWKTGDVHPDGKTSSADIVAMKKLQANMEISKAGAAGAQDMDGNGFLALIQILLGNQTLTANKSSNVSYLRDDNGNAVMPISGFWGPKKVDYTANGLETNFIQDQYYQMIADLGINLINYIENDSATNSDTLAQNLRNLSLAEKYNIGIYILDSAVSGDMSNAELANRLSQYGKYTSFAGLLAGDEPTTDSYNPNNTSTGKTVDGISALAQNVNQYANLNAYSNLFGNRETEAEFKAYVEEYIAKCNPKNTSFDFYPFESGTYWNTNQYNIFKDDLEKGHARYFSSLKVMRETALAADIPFWSFIQVGDNFSTEVDTTTNLTPTKSQFMWNVNTSLAYGAKGIEYFPMIQPYYYANESATTLDYERNGLIGANGEKTKWYAFAKDANTWIQMVDEILMDATSTGMLAVGSKMTAQTGYSSSGNGVTVSGGNSNYGALVGAFDYNGKMAYYVVNGNYSTASDTDTTTNVITLTFDGAKTGTVYQQDKAETTTLNGSSVSLTLPMGGAALVVVE